MSDTVRLIVFGLLGALFGSAGSDSTPLLGAVIGVLLALHLRDAARIKRLEAGASGVEPVASSRERANLRGRLVATADVVPREEPTAEPDLRGDSDTDTEPTVPERVPQPRADRPSASVRPRVQARLPREPDAVTLALRRAWVFVTGGNPIARVAVLVLFVGLGLLIRYAADEGFFPVEARLLFAAAAGAVLVGLGLLLRKRATAFALTLQGGGVAILYLTTYAAYTLFGFLSSPVAIGLMAIIAIGCGILALVQDEPVLAVIGVAGGFAAPILAGTQDGSHTILFGYYALLNLGVLGIAWTRGWRSVSLVGFAATFVTGGLWGGLAYKPELYASTQPFVLLSFAIYFALSVRFALRSLAAQKPPERSVVVDGSLVFGLPAATFALQAGLVEGIPYGRAWSAVSLAAVYLVGAAVFYRRGEGLRLLADSFLAVGLVFATLAVPLAFQKIVVGALWVLEGAALVWTGSRQNKAWMRWVGIALQAGAAGVLLAEGVVDPERAFSAETLTGWIVAVALGLSSYVLSRRQDRRSLEPVARSGLMGFALFWWCATSLVHVLDLAPSTHEVAVGLGAAGASAILFRALGATLRWPGLRAAAFAALPIAALVWAIQVFNGGHPLGALRWLGWLAVLVGAAWSVRGHPGGVLKSSAFGATSWLAVAIAAHELSWLAEQGLYGDGWPMAAVGFCIALALLAVALVPATVVDSTDRSVASWGLVYAGLMWMLSSWTFPGGAAPLIYIPVLAPIDLASIVLLSALAKGVRAATAGNRAIGVGVVLIVAVAAITASVGRAVHNMGGVPFGLDSLGASSVYQAALAIVWTLMAVALTFLGTRRSNRFLWVSGVGLLALVVVKLFAIDLSQAAALVRIGAFLVVGVLGLVVAYASPLPPRRPDDGLDATAAREQGELPETDPPVHESD